MSGLSKLNKLKRTNNNFEKNKELVDKMKKGLRIKLVNTLSTGEFVYECPITRMQYTLKEYQEELVFGFDEFNHLANSKKGILRSFAIMPVYCEIDDYEFQTDNLEEEQEKLLKEVLRIFNLGDIYGIDSDNTGGDYLYEEILEDILALDYKDFEEVVSEIPLALYEKVVMRAIHLNKEGKLNDMKKINYFIESTDNADLFIDDKPSQSSKTRRIR